jgi:transcriptional regulator of acetoin/glycerol metabolism
MFYLFFLGAAEITMLYLQIWMIKKRCSGFSSRFQTVSNLTMVSRDEKVVPLQKLRENLTMGKTQREIIHQSHERSKKLGIVRGSDFRRRLLSANQVRKLLKENEGLINAAAPIVESLFDFLKGSGFFIILTDCSGRILEIEGDTVALMKLQCRNIPGTMDERSIGTNHGHSYIREWPDQVTATEHFLTRFPPMDCSACPVHDTTDRLQAF